MTKREVELLRMALLGGPLGGPFGRDYDKLPDFARDHIDGTIEGIVEQYEAKHGKPVVVTTTIGNRLKAAVELSAKLFEALSRTRGMLYSIRYGVGGVSEIHPAIDNVLKATAGDYEIAGNPVDVMMRRFGFDQIYDIKKGVLTWVALPADEGARYETLRVKAQLEPLSAEEAAELRHLAERRVGDSDLDDGC